MKLNINKDKLLKHKFWVMLVVAVPLILAGQFILLVPVAGEIDASKKKLLAEIATANGVKPPFVNQNDSKKKLDQASELQKQENEVWATVFKRQAGATFWPAPIEAKYPVHSGKFLRELKYLEGAAAPVPDDEHHLTGKLVDRDADSLHVQLKDGKKIERLYRVAPEDMKLDNGKSLFDLPLGKDAQFTFQTGWYFNDKLTQTQQSEYNNSYYSQIRPILDIVEPVNEEGEGVVLLKDWLVPKSNKTELPPPGARFLRFVPPPWKTDDDISEEAWIAQEDLWIQKEIYHLVRQANDYVGKMVGKSVEGPNKLATFKNPYFELSLKLIANDKAEMTIKNLRNRRQKLEVSFKIRFTKDPSVPDERIPIDGEPLDPKGGPKDTLAKVIDLAVGPKRTGVYNVEQALTWETAAVRRIDLVSIGSMSPEEIALNHRSYPDNVKPLVPKKEDPAATVEPGANPNPPVPGAIAPVPFPGRGPGFRGGGWGPGVGPAAAELTINGLVKNRYSEEPTEQTRRLPVAIALIIDQDHFDRVLASFGNSKFRFVLNQMLYNRYPLSVRPPIVNQDGLNPVGPQPPFIRGPGFGPRGPGIRPFGPPIGPGFGGPGLPGLDRAHTGDEEMEANVELVLYGTVTLYQRYPAHKLPKAAEPEAPKQ